MGPKLHVCLIVQLQGESWLLPSAFAITFSICVFHNSSTIFEISDLKGCFIYPFTQQIFTVYFELDIFQAPGIQQ